MGVSGEVDLLLDTRRKKGGSHVKLLFDRAWPHDPAESVGVQTKKEKTDRRK